MAAQPIWGNEDILQTLGVTPDLLAYGDSWFWYLNDDLLIPINAIWGGTKTLLAKGKNGAELSEMVGGTPRLAQNHEVCLVETAGTLHPTPAGFQKLGECFRPLMQQLFPGTP